MLNLHSTMKYAKDVDVVIGFDQVSNSLAPEQKNANVPVRMRAITVANLGKLSEDFRVFGDGENCSSSRRWIIPGDVGVDPSQPPLCLSSPPQRCHERIRLSISSWLIVRPASESANPRSTM